MTAFSTQVSASNRDAQMASVTDNSGRAPTNSGIVTLTDTILKPGSHGSNDEWPVGCGMQLNIPQGENIISALLTLTGQANYSSGGTIRYYISAQAADNAGVFTTTNGDLNTTARPRTTAFTTMTLNSVVAGTEYSVDVTAIVQEIVNRAGFVSGNYIVFLIDTHEDTTTGEWQDLHGYDGNPSLAPKLSGEYGTPVAPTRIVTYAGFPKEKMQVA